MNKVILEQEIPVRKEDGDHFIFQDCTGEKKTVTVGSIIAFKGLKSDGIAVAHVIKLSCYDLYVNGCKQDSYVSVSLVIISDDGNDSKYETGQVITIDFRIVDNVVTSKSMKIFILDKNYFKDKLNDL